MRFLLIIEYICELEQYTANPRRVSAFVTRHFGLRRWQMSLHRDGHQLLRSARKTTSAVLFHFFFRNAHIIKFELDYDGFLDCVQWIDSSSLPVYLCMRYSISRILLSLDSRPASILWLLSAAKVLLFVRRRRHQQQICFISAIFYDMHEARLWQA